MKSTALALAGALACAHGAALAATSGRDGSAQWMCGGIGSDERYAMEGAARTANLALEMFVVQGGEYVADVDVTIRPSGAQAAPLTLRSDGPICYLQVAPGQYRIEATFSGITRGAQATVPAKTNRPVQVRLGFPKSVGDRQNDAASPEEKEQAARRP
jgi:hypothetical protein